MREGGARVGGGGGWGGGGAKEGRKPTESRKLFISEKTIAHPELKSEN